MAKVKVKSKRIVSKKEKFESPFRDYWQNTNYILFGLGLVVLVIGFYLMTFGPFDNPVSLSIAPVVILVSYLIIFPAAIFYTKKQKEHKLNTESHAENTGNIKVK
ncbi:MAG: DUF3098 domain-containing protein [Ignavibacteriales bacterium]|nr:DUF3098 domain-containing protein [Ignavibacteriales bacterium]MCF8306072.1 DUF3098 domain-containing protein [Ignavibacteriales bacterium]MCF8315873.1 DUF3098 domain-containing protein [Ignavibacteriales bacterium]MCF8437333.1 DUF3098 domain-containing protein [Ignavibacteriales bacterium]